MSGVPRSQSLIRFISSAANDARAFAVPAGFVVLLKSVHVHNQSAAAVNIDVRVYAGATGMSVVLASPDAGKTVEWNGWLALNSTDSVYALAAAAGVAIWVSGAVLAGPAQFPPGTREAADALLAEVELHASLP